MKSYRESHWLAIIGITPLYLIVALVASVGWVLAGVIAGVAILLREAMRKLDTRSRR